jgi:hypothetical protein
MPAGDRNVDDIAWNTHCQEFQRRTACGATIHVGDSSRDYRGVYQKRFMR